MMRLSEDTLIKTAEGKHHKLRSGTILYCSTSMAQRDGSQWKDPTIFRSKRFIENLQNSMPSKFDEQIGEPLPTLGFGCPIHRSDRIEPISNMHQCPFLPLAPSFLKAFLRLLIGNYKWSFDDDVLENGIPFVEAFKSNPEVAGMTYEELGINPKDFENYDIHIHVPEGATPKDGQSAGIASFNSVVSSLTNNLAYFCTMWQSMFLAEVREAALYIIVTSVCSSNE